MNKLVANRIGGVDFFANPNIYRFSELLKLKKEKKKDNSIDLLDFGIGEPNDLPSRSTIITLSKEANKLENSKYADNGVDDFNQGIIEYMKKEYDVSLEKDEVIHCIGAKSALTIFPLGFVNEGDYVLSCSPGYVVLENMTRWLKGNVYHLPLTKENNFYPRLDEVNEEILYKTKILYLNYPNNPTGQIATKDFYKMCIEYAKKYNFIIVSDAAYLPLTYDKQDRISFLQVEGAKDVGVEVHTLSKGFNMTGYRIGFVIGNKKIIQVFGAVKENMDSGQFIPIQKAALKALEDKKHLDLMIEKYKRRQFLLEKILKKFNLRTFVSKAGFYQYVEVPNFVNGKNIQNANEFALFLLNNEDIFTIPYDDAGSYIRFSLTFKSDTLEEDIKYLEKLYIRLKKYNFNYKN